MFDHQERNIKDILKEIVSSNKKLEKGVVTVQIEDAWKSEMGEMINTYTEKMYFKNGVLTVYVTSSALRNQLATNKNKVMDILNKACGMDHVQEVVFR